MSRLSTGQSNESLPLAQQHRDSLTTLFCFPYIQSRTTRKHELESECELRGTTSVSWNGPNRILSSVTKGNIKITYAFGRSPHPHSSAMCSRAFSRLPPTLLWHQKPGPHRLTVSRRSHTVLVPAQKERCGGDVATSWMKPGSSGAGISPNSQLHWLSVKRLLMKRLLHHVGWRGNRF